MNGKITLNDIIDTSKSLDYNWNEIIMDNEEMLNSIDISLIRPKKEKIDIIKEVIEEIHDYFIEDYYKNQGTEHIDIVNIKDVMVCMLIIKRFYESKK